MNSRAPTNGSGAANSAHHWNIQPALQEEHCAIERLIVVAERPVCASDSAW